MWLRMKTLVVMLLVVHGAAAVPRSLKYFYAASSGVSNLPEFISFCQVDGVEIMHYDVKTRRAAPKQDWMNKVTAEDPNFWETQTQILRGHQETSKVNIELLKQRFNLTGGVHMIQVMSGCEWDDETGETDGFDQHAFDGEDFIYLNLKTLTWVAANPQAVSTKEEWDHDELDLQQVNKYLTQDCIAWLRKFLVYGKRSLLRTEHPSMWLLQRTPSSPVSCFATGFFPDRAMILWRKDGEQLHEDVSIGELLPNHDGTFQISANLTLPKDATDLQKYECVFKLSGLKDLVYKLDTHSIKTNHKNPFDATTAIIIVVMALVLLALASIAVTLYKKRKAQCPPPASNSDFELRLNPDS